MSVKGALVYSGDSLAGDHSGKSKVPFGQGKSLASSAKVTKPPPLSNSQQGWPPNTEPIKDSVKPSLSRAQSSDITRTEKKHDPSPKVKDVLPSAVDKKHDTPLKIKDASPRPTPGLKVQCEQTAIGTFEKPDKPKQSVKGMDKQSANIIIEKPAKVQGYEEKHSANGSMEKSDKTKQSGQGADTMRDLHDKLKPLSRSLDFRLDSTRRSKELTSQNSVGGEKAASTKGPAANGGEKAASGKVPVNKGIERNTTGKSLCTECRAISEGAVCFIGNDGRVSACTSRTAVRLCKNLSCANNNPELAAALAAAPKKYLVSRRHSMKNPSMPVSNKSGKSASASTKAALSKANDTATKTPGNLASSEGDDQEELDDDHFNMEGMSNSEARNAKKPDGYQRMRRRSFSVIEKQGPEVVTLRKHMTQERKQAEEWMLDYAIEEALHKLEPTGGTKVKVLVEAFESIIPHKDVDGPMISPKTPPTKS